MSIKVQFKKEIHLFKGDKTYEDLLTFVESSFQKLPTTFILYYLDSDNDNITLSCDEDFLALIETHKGTPKIFIEEDDVKEPFLESKESSF